MRYIPCMLVVFGSVAVAGAQVRAPEFTSYKTEQMHDRARLTGDVKIRLVGTVDIHADEADVSNEPNGDIRLRGNVVPRLVPSPK